MSVKDAIRKQSKQKTVQNRTNRVNTKAKKYNKEVSKSDKAYIQGDLRKSSSMKAYGVRKALSDGQTVYGYGDDDIYTGGRKASNYKALQRGEKGVYETKYIKTRQTKDNPTVVKNADGSTSVYKSRYLTNKEKKNLDKYGDLKHRPNNIEKASKKIGSSVVKGLETLNKGQSAFLGGLKTIGDESQEMFFEPDKYKQTGGVKDTLSKLKTNIKDGWDKPTQSFGSIINEKMDKYESENDFKYSKAGRFNASASGLAMDVFNPYDLTPNVPVGTMLRGTGKSFTKVPTKVDADDVAKRLDKILDGKEISDIKKQHIIHKATQKANKMAGNINPNAMHGINIGNKELVSGQKVAEFADHLPMARTYNEIRHIIQKKKRGANLEDVIADVAKKKIGKSVDLVKPLTKTPLALQKEVYDTSTGFMPDFKIKQQIKELDNGFNNKTYEKPKSEYDELTEMLQGAIKESGRRVNSGFKDITNHSDNLKPKIFDATDVQDIITSGDVRTDSLGRGLKPSKRRKGSSEYNAIFGSDNPITMTPRANLSDNASDLLDESILKERFVQEKQMKEYMNKLAKSNKTNKKIKVDDIKPRVKLNLDDRKSNFKSIYDNLDPKKITKEQQDVMSAVKALNNKSSKEEKQILIDKMNDVFFGGNSVIDDDIKPSKLKKIESFINELNTKKNVKFDDRYTQTLLRDLTDPIIDEKYSRLGKKYGYKKISEFTDRIKEIESILEANKQNKTLDNDTFKNLLWERSSLQKKVDSRNSELADDLKLNSVDFFERYPEMATGYRKNAYDGNGVLESFDDIQRNYINDNFTSSEAKFDDMVEEISNQIRPEIKLEAIMNKKNFKNKKEMDAWIQKQTMLEAEVIAKRNHSGLERVNKAESQHIAKGNRQEVDIDVKTKRIKEMNDAVRQHRKKLDLKYVDLKNKDKNKSIVEAKKNLMKIVESKWNDELDSDAVSELYRQQFQYLDKLGVDRGSYLEKFKTYEKKMEIINKMKRDYLNKDEFDFADVPPMVKFDLQMLASRINKGESIEKIAKEVTDEFIGNSNQVFDTGVFDATKSDSLVSMFDDIRTKLPNRETSDFKLPDKKTTELPFDDELSDFMHGNTSSDTPMRSSEPLTEEAIQKQIDKLMGVESKPLEGQLELPRPTTEEINKMAKDSDKKNPFLSLYDGLTKDFKSLVTVSKPGWHGANYIQNKVLNAQDIGIDALKGRKEAKNIFKGGEGSITNPKTGEIFSYDKLREILEETGLMDNGIMGDLKNNSGSNPLSKFFHDVVRPSGKNSISTFGGALQKNNDETYSKIQNVISHIKNGDEVFDAIDKSNKTLFDYDDLSKFEKDVMKRLIPFYAYGKKNTLNQAEYLMNDQRSFVKAMRGVKGFESAIPNEDKREIRDDESYLDDRVQLPFSKEQDGKKYDYMLNPKLPLQLKGSMDLGANPLIEPLLDIAKNEDFFGDEIEDKGKYYKDKVSGSFTPPLVKLMKKVEKSKKDDKEFKITPDILNYLLGISGNYY